MLNEKRNESASERFPRLLQLLLEKSRENGVDWRPSPRYDRQYLTKFPSEEITVGFISPETEPDFYYADLSRGGSAVLREAANQNDRPKWDLLSALYSEAERIAVGWDQALDDVEKALKSGWKPPAHAAAAPITDDDIPF